MKTLDELIEKLEWGLDRAEDPTWSALIILADKEGEALLKELKRIQNILTQEKENA